MKKIIFCIIVIFAFNVFGVNLYAGNIDLAKLQKEEKERRKKLLKPKFSVNNENLYGIISKIKSKGNFCQIKIDPMPICKYDEPIVYEKTRGYWQEIKQGLEKRVKQLKIEVAELQLKCNDLFRRYLCMGLEIEQRKLKEQFNYFNMKLKCYKKELKRFQDKLDNLPEKARKANIPPGWIR